MIYKMWNGSYVDLSKIAHVSELEYVPEHFGYPIFHVHFQLMEKPVYFKFDLHDKVDRRPMRIDENRSFHGETVKVHNLEVAKANEDGFKAVYDKFISDWKAYRESNS